MSMHFKLLFAAAAAALALAAVVGTALAGRLSVDDQDFVFTYDELEYEGGGFTVRCEAELAGRFSSRTFAKVSRGVIGTITSASASSCDGGGWTYLAGTLPWDVQFHSFAGSLPRITGITLLFINYSFAVDIPGLGARCLARGTSSEPVGEILALNASGSATSLDTSTAFTLDANDVEGTLCDLFDVTVTFFGAATVEDDESNLVFIRLI